MKTIFENTVFTNVAKTSDGGVYWEGMEMDPKSGVGVTDWTGKPWTPDCGRPAAHPNSRLVFLTHYVHASCLDRIKVLTILWNVGSARLQANVLSSTQHGRILKVFQSMQSSLEVGDHREFHLYMNLSTGSMECLLVPL
jgi:hypothetical protein